jgi:galactokinase
VEYTHQSVRDQFVQRFRKEPLLVRSPGRINLIGEHTDYNDGFVMPAAIDKEIVFAIAFSDDNQSKVCALNYDEIIDFDLNNPKPVSTPSWANYILGVARQLIDRNKKLKPFVCVFGGNIPTGSGVSSSAALECGFAFALDQLNSLYIPRTELAKIGQWSEHNFVGARVGIMDQFANLMGKENHVIQLDCRSLQCEYYPIQLKQHSIVLFNTGVKHSLASSEYNTRRAECEEGVRFLKKKYPKVKSLRDVSIEMIDSNQWNFTENVYKRCKFVVQEIERVQLAGKDLLRSDIQSVGKRMFETHEGLSTLYQVSCGELDFLVSLVKNREAVLGARMMGGGFGGCTINIIRNENLTTIIEGVTKAYREKFGIDIEHYIVKITDGTTRITA